MNGSRQERWIAWGRIRGALPSIATAAAALTLACGGAATPGPARPRLEDSKPLVVLPPEQLYVLEVSGIPPEDTTITFLTGQPRTIILRHGAPDNTVFAQFNFPADAFEAPKDSLAPRDSVKMEIHPHPGLYGIDVQLSALPEKGATILFKYPVHFAAPNAAIVRYGSRARYERALMVGVRIDSTSIGLLESDRPASDNLRAAFLGSGTYLVAAPR